MMTSALKLTYTFRNFPAQTNDVDFSKVFAVDLLEDETQKLCSDATNSRDAMTQALKSGEPKLIAKLTDAYFKHGWSVLRSIEEIKSAYRVSMQGGLSFKWTSSIADLGSKQHEGHVLIYDLIQTLVTRGMAYTNFAASLIESGSYKPAGTALRVAAGIFEAAANKLVPKWKNLKNNDVPPESHSEVCSMLKDFTMAVAQQATILLAIEAGKTKMVPGLLIGLGDRFERVSKIAGMFFFFFLYIHLFCFSPQNSPFLKQAPS